ncbi:MAG: hypothetical protein Q8941_05155 [Bacteroidota bacterium]|nr:hypothetical protein [Bacteroidota bacterium]
MHDIISSEISPASEQQELTGEEKSILWNLRNKKLIFFIPSYLSLSYVFVEGWARVYPGTYWEAVKELFRFRIYPTWYLLFLFLILTIFFARYYLKSIHPLFKDLKAGKKQIIFFVPGKYQTPFFAEYYLKTPSQKTPLLRIDKDLYDTIQSNSAACIKISLYAKFVFSIEVNGIKEEFNYSTSFDDI